MFHFVHAFAHTLTFIQKYTQAAHIHIISCYPEFVVVVVFDVVVGCKTVRGYSCHIFLFFFYNKTSVCVCVGILNLEVESGERERTHMYILSVYKVGK